MGYRRGSIYYFNTATDTGMDAVPVGYQVVVRDAGDTFVLNDKTGIDANSTVQDTVDAGLVTVTGGGGGSATYINTPTIVLPTNNAVDTKIGLTVTGSTYTTGETFAGAHTNSILEVTLSTDTGFANVVETVTTGLESLVATALSTSTEYIARIKYISGDFSSEWSGVVTFTTQDAGIETPTITDDLADAGKNPTVTVSAYSAVGHSEAQTGLTVRVYDDAGLTSLISEVTNTAADATTVVTGDLVESTTYYVVAFYTSASYTSGTSAAVSFTTTDSFQTLYGVDWDESADTYARTGAADGVALGVTGANSSFVQANMKRCVLRFDGTVNYYLDPTDSTKKADGSAAILDGSDGNVMVEIPKFGYKYTYDTNTHRHELGTAVDAEHPVHPAFLRDRSSDGSNTTNGVSDVTVDFRYMPAYQGRKVLSGATVNADAMSAGAAETTLSADTFMSISGVFCTADLTRDAFRTLAEANGAGWSVQDWYGTSMIQLLMLVEYGSLDSQTVIGLGRTHLDSGSWAEGADSYWAVNGVSNQYGNATHADNYDGIADSVEGRASHSSYRGIENFYGNVRTFIDGVNVLADWQYYVSNTPADFADDVSTNYVKIADGGGESGWTTTFVPTGAGFIPDAVGGSDSVGTCDYYAQGTGNRVVDVGGLAYGALSAGAFYLYAHLDSAADSVYVGSSVSY